MLAAGAAERYHQALEAAALIVAHAGIHKRQDAGKKLVHTLLLIKIINNRRVFAGQLLELFFAPGIGKTAGIEDKSAAVPCLVGGHFAVE